mmetsp:Transcript_74015/g.117940  ORF Transcript_74015/g.117940 Transcript_74015/m.117940 type:complete len:82 (+) Transcript_74015:61-306(+)
MLSEEPVWEMLTERLAMRSDHQKAKCLDLHSVSWSEIAKGHSLEFQMENESERTTETMLGMYWAFLQLTAAATVHCLVATK